MPVVAIPAKQQPIVESISLVGTITANEEVEVKAETDGIVEEILFEEGTLVQKDQPLIRLDETKLQAELTDAESRLKLAQTSFARSQQLFSEKLISQQEFDQSASTFEVAKATVELRKRQLRDARVNAPFKGRTGARSISPGQVITRNTPITWLVDLDPVKVEMNMPERFLGQTSVGQKVRFEVTAYPGESFEGEVYFVTPRLDLITRTALVKTRIPNPDSRLKAGMVANLQLNLKTRENALVIPEAAIIHNGDNTLVFVVTPNQTTRLQPVTLGQHLPRFVEITSGLQTGDLVVVEGHQQIVNGPTGLRMQLMSGVEGALVIPNIPKPISRGFGAPFQLVIQNQDLDALNTAAQNLGNQLRTNRSLVNVRSSYEVTKPELRIDIDRNRAAALGVAVADISRTLQILFGGLDLSRIKQEGKEYDVIAQLERSSRLTPQDLDRIYIRNDRGNLIQLSSVVSHRTGAAANAIEHYNRLRSATLTATPVGVTLGTAIQQVEATLPTSLPPNFLHAWSGESRDFLDTQYQFWWILSLAIVIVYMVLASQFESLVHPLTVMLALPLAGAGAFGLIYILDQGGRHGLWPALPAMNINLFSQIGLILLVGMVTKNSILLVEFANQQCKQGAPPKQAMLQAGLIRLRPILMTTFSTIASILPIAIGFGAGAESRRPMGLAVVGGMTTSTLLTLFVIPVVYTLFSDLGNRLRHKPAPSITPQA